MGYGGSVLVRTNVDWHFEKSNYPEYIFLFPIYSSQTMRTVRATFFIAINNTPQESRI